MLMQASRVHQHSTGHVVGAVSSTVPLLEYPGALRSFLRVFELIAGGRSDTTLSPSTRIKIQVFCNRHHSRLLPNLLCCCFTSLLTLSTRLPQFRVHHHLHQAFENSRIPLPGNPPSVLFELTGRQMSSLRDQ